MSAMSGLMDIDVFYCLECGEKCEEKRDTGWIKCWFCIADEVYGLYMQVRLQVTYDLPQLVRGLQPIQPP